MSFSREWAISLRHLGPLLAVDRLRGTIEPAPGWFCRGDKIESDFLRREAVLKLIRYQSPQGPRFGELVDDRIVPLEGAFPEFRPVPNAKHLCLSDERLLTPVQPSKIVAVGPNYRAHLAGRPHPARPFLWVKPPSTCTNPGDPIVLPREWPDAVPFNHESEIAMVIGRHARNVAVDEAAQYIYGYTCINDVTGGKMDDKPAFRGSNAFVDGKIFDTFAPLGPWIETGFDPSDVRIRCSVNGELRQDHRSSDMIWSCHELLVYISSVMSLVPGDVIATGSPPGSKPLHPGDQVEIDIEGLGMLANPVC